MTLTSTLVALATSSLLAAGGVLGGPQPAATAPADRTIDLLVVYTAAAEQERGGPGGIEAAVESSAAGMNRALERSGIEGAVNVVDTVRVGYTASGKQNTDLDWLKKDRQVAQLREQHSADLVSLVVPGGAGLAQRPNPAPGTDSQAFSVVGGEWLEPNEVKGEAGVFAHEIGHNLGSGHDWDSSPEPIEGLPYAKGHVTPNGLVDIMAYNTAASCAPNCRRVPYYSNPDLTVEGERFGATGGDRPSDLARLFGDTIPVVAGYR